jgi:hypothetical protein
MKLELPSRIALVRNESARRPQGCQRQCGVQAEIRKA